MTQVQIIAASAAYGVVAMFLLRPIAGHFAWYWARDRRVYEVGDRPDTDPWTAAFALALVIVAVWPAALVFALSMRVGPRVGAERLAQLELREKRVRELEREMGL